MNKGNGTSYNFRDARLTATCDIFYGPKGHDYALNWQSRNDHDFNGKDGNFSKQDIRLFWSSYGSRNLSEVWPCYYESQEVYSKLLKIKEAVDPEKIFSATSFNIGGARVVV